MGERSFEVGEFDSVALAGSYKVLVDIGDAPAVHAEGDDVALERLDVRVEGRTLRIRSGRSPLDFRTFGRRATIYVTAPQTLNGARVAGSGSMRVQPIRSRAFEAAVSGSGSLQIEELHSPHAEFALSGSGHLKVGALEAERLDAAISGSGSLRAAGSAEHARVALSGSGSARLDDLQTRRTSVSAAGSGSVVVRASEAADGCATGSGSVTVHGTAHCTIMRSGSGTVRCDG